jgi:dTDP-4-dehydrorhamnose reductase
MLGRDVLEAFDGRGHEVIPLTHDELDITHGPTVDARVGEIEPDAIINCSAWTDVDGAEAHERDAMTVNDTGAGLLAVAAGRQRCLPLHRLRFRRLEAHAVRRVRPPAADLRVRSLEARG